LAVLPLENLSGDASQDYFAEGMKAAATKALALDDSLGEAHTSLAFALDRQGIPAGNCAQSRLCHGSSLVCLAFDRDGTQ